MEHTDVTNITIDRLALHLSGLSETDSRRLTDAVAAVLAEAHFQAAEDRYVETISLRLTAEPGGRMEAMAAQIADAILQQLRQEI